MMKQVIVLLVVFAQIHGTQGQLSTGLPSVGDFTDGDFTGQYTLPNVGDFAGPSTLPNVGDFTGSLPGPGLLPTFYPSGFFGDDGVTIPQFSGGDDATVPTFLSGDDTTVSSLFDGDDVTGGGDVTGPSFLGGDDATVSSLFDGDDVTIGDDVTGGGAPTFTPPTGPAFTPTAGTPPTGPAFTPTAGTLPTGPAFTPTAGTLPTGPAFTPPTGTPPSGPVFTPPSGPAFTPGPAVTPPTAPTEPSPSSTPIPSPPSPNVDKEACESILEAYLNCTEVEGSNEGCLEKVDTSVEFLTECGYVDVVNGPDSESPGVVIIQDVDEKKYRVYSGSTSNTPTASKKLPKVYGANN